MATLEDLQAHDLDHAAVMMKAILNGEDAPQWRRAREMALLNAAGALVVTEAADDFRQGLALADEAVKSGKARRTLEDLVRCSQ